MPRSLSFCLTTLTIASAVAGCCAPGGSKAPSLIDADLAFARSAAAQGVASAFHDNAAPNSVVLSQEANPVFGRENIFRLLSIDSGVLTWRPRGADTSRSGELGYTWGEYEYLPGGTNGAAATRRPTAQTSRRKPDLSAFPGVFFGYQFHGCQVVAQVRRFVLILRDAALKAILENIFKKPLRGILFRILSPALFFESCQPGKKIGCVEK